jgi:hypothetical protein
MVDIEKMTTSQWLNYRDDLIEDFYSKGFVLKPSIGCSQFDVINDYICFDCEDLQIKGKS